MLDRGKPDFVSSVWEECSEVVDDVLKVVLGVEHRADEAELEDGPPLFADHCGDVDVICCCVVVKGRR